MPTTFDMETKRMLKARSMLEHGLVPTRKGEGIYLVDSQSNKSKVRTVIFHNNEWSCDCPDNEYNRVKCKHIWSVILHIERKSKEIRTIEPIDDIKCPECGYSKYKKFGVRHNKCGDIQRYKCDLCGKVYSINIGFEKMKHNPKAVTTAMQLYFSGESLRNTQRSLKFIGVEVSHQTVSNWIEKYITLMKQYVDNLKPEVGNTWRADEIWLKVKGDLKYLFALMDDETRYWIAQEVADTKHNHDAGKLFIEGKKITGKKPDILITDGLAGYNEAFRREYYTNKEPKSKHIHTIKLRGDMNNNKMERINGEIRDREKTMRGLKKKDTTILQGYQIFHNYIRPHESLKGKTPADACGITVKGENKWITLIQNASNLNTPLIKI